MLRKIRITLATVCFVLINLLFLGVSWGLSQHIAWVAKIQFLPALLALDYAVLLILMVVRLVAHGEALFHELPRPFAVHVNAGSTGRLGHRVPKDLPQVMHQPRRRQDD